MKKVREVLDFLDELARGRAAEPPPKDDGLPSVERLTEILDEAEGDGIIGPDYTPPRLAEYIRDRLGEK